MVGCLHLQIFMDIKVLKYLQVLSTTLFLCFLSYMTGYKITYFLALVDMVSVYMEIDLMRALAVYSYIFIGHVITLCAEVIICLYSAFV